MPTLRPRCKAPFKCTARRKCTQEESQTISNTLPQSFEALEDLEVTSVSLSDVGPNRRACYQRFLEGDAERSETPSAVPGLAGPGQVGKRRKREGPGDVRRCCIRKAASELCRDLPRLCTELRKASCRGCAGVFVFLFLESPRC